MLHVMKKLFLCLSMILLSSGIVRAETLDLPEMDIHLDYSPITDSQDPTNFRSVSHNDQIAIIGRGIRDQITGEVISLVCVDHEEGNCGEVQPGSVVKKTLFVFGQKMSLTEAKKSFPAAFFERNGWNWSRKPVVVSEKKFYRIKKRLAKRALKDFEKRGYWDDGSQWIPLGKHGCLSDVQIDLGSLRSSILMFDVQAQVAELFAQRYRCVDEGSVLRISARIEQGWSKRQIAITDRAAKRHECVQFESYPSVWSISLFVTNASGAKVFSKTVESKTWWSNKKTFKREFNAHELLFKLIDPVE